jgi:hypothetical protein
MLFVAIYLAHTAHQSSTWCSHWGVRNVHHSWSIIRRTEGYVQTSGSIPRFTSGHAGARVATSSADFDGRRVGRGRRFTKLRAGGCAARGQ